MNCDQAILDARASSWCPWPILLGKFNWVARRLSPGGRVGRHEECRRYSEIQTLTTSAFDRHRAAARRAFAFASILQTASYYAILFGKFLSSSTRSVAGASSSFEDIDGALQRAGLNFDA